MSPVLAMSLATLRLKQDANGGGGVSILGRRVSTCRSLRTTAPYAHATARNSVKAERGLHRSDLHVETSIDRVREVIDAFKQKYFVESTEKAGKH
eukprot:scaffold1231_cov187-Pinguiococcus_pyrenoidosus.AAC.7